MNFLPATWFDHLDSTNRQLQRLMVEKPDLPAGTVIAARGQTAGRGRGQRIWLSTPGKDLTFSFLMQTESQKDYFPTLTLATGLSIAKTLSDNLELPARLKWPNDVLLHKKKVCGILCESAGTTDRQRNAIVGIGLNVNMSDADTQKIDRPATSLKRHTGHTVDVEETLIQILDGLEKTLHQWESEGFGSLKAQWLARCDDIGRQITLARPDGRSISGTFTDIGSHGEVQLTDPQGTSYSILAGDMLLNSNRI